MTTIDQRILIPASPNIIWEKVSDLSNNVNWQTDYQDISFLSASHQGAHTRWRYRRADRREYILEITAWYDGLGYEYTIVDGGPYRENRGRIRLQETPEGTVVQWTFSYELGGLFGGVRNALGLKRQLETLMIESLKTLWQQVKDSAPARYESKALIREALDYDERSRYKPRHASQRDDEEVSTPVAADSAVSSSIEEPPITDEDTRPRPAVSMEPAANVTGAAVNPFARPATNDEPDFLKYASEDTEPRPLFREPATPELEPPITDALGEEPTEKAAAFMRDARLTEADNHVPFRPADSTETDVQPAPETPVEPVATPEVPVPASGVSEPKPVDKLDTATVSIWEVFGIQRPSETQEMAAVTKADIEAAEAAVKDASSDTTDVAESGVLEEDKPESVDLTPPVALIEEAPPEVKSAEPEQPMAVVTEEPATTEAAFVSDAETDASSVVEPVPMQPAEITPVEIVPASEGASPVDAGAVTLTSHDKAVGLRVRLRRKQVRLRR